MSLSPARAYRQAHPVPEGSHARDDRRRAYDRLLYRAISAGSEGQIAQGPRWAAGLPIAGPKGRLPDVYDWTGGNAT